MLLTMIDWTKVRSDRFFELILAFQDVFSVCCIRVFCKIPGQSLSSRVYYYKKRGECPTVE